MHKISYMKINFTSLTFLCCLLLGVIQTNVIDAQRKCGTPHFDANKRAAYEEWISDVLQKENQFANLKKASVVYVIPVVFHIIHSGQAVGSSYNISQAQINSQLNTLNLDYRKQNPDFSTTVTQPAFIAASADCEINFCFATRDPSGNVLAEAGIDRVNTVAKGWTAPPYQGLNEPGGYIDNTIKTGSIWDPTKYYNIWVLAMNDGVLGYAQFPTVPSGVTPNIGDMFGQGGSASTDGVVLDYKAVGSIGTAAAPYNKGRTATHETGHWLGLYHPNGDSNCGNDYCSDTPTLSSLTGGCPSLTGGTAAAGCTVSPNPPGKMYQDFMDYSDDKCLTMFTNNQKSRMQACMANCVRRTSLATSTVCSSTNINEAKSNMNVSIFPNPTNGELFINIDVINPQDITLSIINTLGQTIKEIRQTQCSGGIIKIDLSDQSTGVYFVSLKSKAGSFSKRIFLQ